MPPAVQTQDLSVRVDGATLLAPVTVTVPEGSCLAVTGANGSGKTTLLRALAGLPPRSTGWMSVAGRAVDERDHAFRRAVAAHVGPPPFARDLTLTEHLTLVATTWGCSPDEAAAAAQEVLVELGLTRLGGRYPHQLSSGQQHLAGLALTLVRPSDVLLLDEPEQRLDADRVEAVVAALRRRLAAGRTVVLTTHDPRLVDSLADGTVHLEVA